MTTAKPPGGRTVQIGSAKDIVCPSDKEALRVLRLILSDAKWPRCSARKNHARKAIAGACLRRLAQGDRWRHAHVLLSAPALLAALRRIVAECDGGMHDAGTYGMTRARAALARAKGGAS